MDEPGQVQQSRGHSWWQDWRWLAAVAALLMGVAAGTLAITSITTNSTVEDQSDVVDRLEDLAATNSKAIGRIDSAIAQIEHNQEGIDELVAFVRDLQAQPDASSDLFERAVNLLCASSDPARLAACAELQP